MLCSKEAATLGKSLGNPGSIRDSGSYYNVQMEIYITVRWKYTLQYYNIYILYIHQEVIYYQTM